MNAADVELADRIFEIIAHCEQTGDADDTCYSGALEIVDIFEQQDTASRALVEAETIERCKNAVAEYYGTGAGSIAISNIPRKYQPTENKP